MISTGKRLAGGSRINTRVHRTTHVRPVERLEEEQLAPLPPAFAWERFATEERHP